MSQFPPKSRESDGFPVLPSGRGVRRRGREEEGKREGGRKEGASEVDHGCLGLRGSFPEGEKKRSPPKYKI